MAIVQIQTDTSSSFSSECFALIEAISSFDAKSIVIIGCDYFRYTFLKIERTCDWFCKL